MLVLCDTNVFIHLLINHQPTISILATIGSPNIIMSAITEMELYRGMRNQSELKKMVTNINNYSIIDIDVKTSVISRGLIKTYHLSHGLQIPDALIAASAIAYELPLFTYNTKDFHFIKNLILYTP